MAMKKTITMKVSSRSKAARHGSMLTDCGNYVPEPKPWRNPVDLVIDLGLVVHPCTPPNWKRPGSREMQGRHLLLTVDQEVGNSNSPGGTSLHAFEPAWPARFLTS